MNCKPRILKNESFRQSVNDATAGMIFWTDK
ncbi:hypothetical protein J2Y45_000782 [Dyadobacter sp. BE34]|uniref:Uncharacterized protein n=1 Tax=Dyadobacter fermentans TaxID=94254 RepID=A0ABU1QQY8_9BACT|nr:hypothetical protein [Dyadobacter fermentans]MDR7041253.1 hypothetical protein [Dyadobacter sp. BE242]MDR7195656.1 hypothetical protein [Dyadobacter sp. BE34]MDR7213799.1 hypothetical protein [Dyadobacter sp. BE31]MDR7261063.1 hypothetical protein [Dyadobacter sp. BE32]